MWRVDSEEKKLVLRGAVTARRNSLTRQECLFLSRAIQSRALKLPPYKVSLSVALYSATQNEVITEAILEHALDSGRRVFYPRITAEGAGEFIRIRSSAELRAGRYGIREPSGTEPLPIEDCPGLTIFVPGVAFDRTGNRLGRGKGWYDRILGQWEGRATIVALAYQFQVVEQVPVLPWDKRVHYIVTENELIPCAASGALRPAARSENEKGVF